MPAKKPASRTTKSKKADLRPPAKKPVRRAAEASKPSAHGHVRKGAANAARKPAHARAAAAERAAPAADDRVKLMQKAADPASSQSKTARSIPPPKTAAGQRTAAPIAAVTPEAEESDAPEPGSLLAGPRNVQPYIPKRGELYMNKEQCEHFREILQNWKRDLMEEVDRTVSHMKDEAANFPDPNDRATQEEEFSLELRTRDRERKLIRKIDEALKRIDDGSYGYCLETGEEIGIKRLEARPVATLSIEAQERRERREKQYGDRDDRYR